MINLMFHDIRDNYSDFFPKRYLLPYFINWSDFIYRIEKLSVNFNFIDLAKLSTGLFSKNDILLTFDDGLKDHLEVANYLYKKGIPAVFFLPAEAIQERVIMQTHAIQFIQASVNEIELSRQIMRILNQQLINANECYQKYSRSFWKNNIWSKDMVFTTRILREFGDFKWRENIIHKLFIENIADIYPNLVDEFYLSIYDAHKIKAMGFDLGGHGYKSLNLIHQTTEDINTEILLCKKFLSENDLEGEILSLSYPNGGFNSEIEAIIQINGFTHAFTTIKDEYSNNSKTAIPRYDGTLDFEMLFTM